MPLYSSVCPVFFSSSFNVSRLTLRSSIHFELIFLQDERDLVLVFYIWIPSFPTLFVEKALFSAVYVFGCGCVGLFLGPLFCSVGLSIYFCSGTILVLLLWPYSII
jgi:hypothetical protein